MSSLDNALITIEFDGEGEVSLGSDEFFVKPQDSGDGGLMLDAARLDLIHRAQIAYDEAMEAAKP